MSRSRRAAPWIALGVFALIVPFMFNSFRVGQFTLVLAYAVAVLGLNVLVGYSGQISLGHGAFFAIGAYTTAILVGKHGWPYLATVPLPGLLAGLAGFLAGFPGPPGGRR